MTNKSQKIGGSGDTLEIIRKHLEKASWQNKEIDELENRKNCLSTLNKLGKKLRGENKSAQESGSIPKGNAAINERK